MAENPSPIDLPFFIFRALWAADLAALRVGGAGCFLFAFGPGRGQGRRSHLHAVAGDRARLDAGPGFGGYFTL